MVHDTLAKGEEEEEDEGMRGWRRNEEEEKGGGWPVMVRDALDLLFSLVIEMQ